MSQSEKYDKVFMDVLSLTSEELKGDVTAGKTHDWDSLGHIHLITKIEDVFDIMFDTEDILNFKSYTEGKEILKKYGINLSNL